MLSPEKRRLLGDLRAAFQYLKEGSEGAEEGLLIWTFSDRTRWNGFTLKEV